jgi:hypothetical protein
LIGALNVAVYSLGIIGGLLSSFFMYDGLLTREEKRRKFLMTKRRFKAFQIHVKEAAAPKVLENILKNAGNPLGLNAFRYQMYRYVLIISLIIYYFLIPLIFHKEFVYWGTVLSIFLLLITSPKIPFSVFSFIMRKVTEIYKSRKNNEIFQLHDLLISEIELMESNQVNIYHILKRLYRNFEHIQPELQELLQPSNWKVDPTPSLEKFAERINTTEAHMLVNILSKFDQHTDREIAISSLESNSKLFGTSQIENYRMRKKLINDIALIPIFITHMLIMGCFIGVIIVLAMNAFNQSNL